MHITYIGQIPLPRIPFVEVADDGHTQSVYVFTELINWSLGGATVDPYEE